MTMIQINMSDAVLAKARERAAAAGMTLDAWLEARAAEVTSVESSVSAADWAQRIVTNADHLGTTTNGWKWNREELYDRKVLR